MLEFVNLLLRDFKHLIHITCHFRRGLSAIKQMLKTYTCCLANPTETSSFNTPANNGKETLSVIAMTVNHCSTNARSITYKGNAASGNTLWLLIELDHYMLHSEFMKKLKKRH